MRIDGHGHACCSYMTLELLLIELDKNKIDKVVLFPAEIGKDKIDKIPDSKNKDILYFSNLIGAFLTRFMDLSKKIDFGNIYVSYLKLLAPNKIIQFYQPTPKYLYKLQSDYNKMHFSGIKLHQCEIISAILNLKLLNNYNLDQLISGYQNYFETKNKFNNFIIDTLIIKDTNKINISLIGQSQIKLYFSKGQELSSFIDFLEKNINSISN